MKIIVCIRVADLEPGRRIEGSREATCEDCAEVVTISPASMRRQAEEPCKVMCLPCALDRVDNAEEYEVVSPTAEQIEELKEFWKK